MGRPPATRLARGLVDAGVRPGDRVAIHLEAANALRWVMAYAAVHRAGAVAVPLNPQLTEPELDPDAGHAEAAAAVMEESLLARYAGAATPLVVAVPRPPADRATTPAATGGPGAPGPGPGSSADDPTYFQVAAGPGGPGRHHVHLGHHRQSQGGGRPPRQLLADPRSATRWSGAVAPRQPALHVRRHWPSSTPR